MSAEKKNMRGRGLNPGELDSFLRRPNLARIATLTPQGSPYVVPVGFYYDGEFVIMFLREFSKSVQNIRQNPHVAVNIDCNATKAGDDGSRALIEGKAEFYDGDWYKLDDATNVKYFGASSPTSEEERKKKPRVCVRVKLSDSKVTSWTGYGWHPRYTRDA
jgi:hypothetical protein